MRHSIRNIYANLPTAFHCSQNSENNYFIWNGVNFYIFWGQKGRAGRKLHCMYFITSSKCPFRAKHLPILTVLWFYKVLHVTMQEKWPTKALLYVVNSHPPFAVHPVLPEQNLSKRHIALKLTL